MRYGILQAVRDFSRFQRYFTEVPKVFSCFMTCLLDLHLIILIIGSSSLVRIFYEFSIKNKESFAEEQYCVVLVGSKADLSDKRQVSTEEGMVCKKGNIHCKIKGICSKT